MEYSIIFTQLWFNICIFKTDGNMFNHYVNISHLNNTNIKFKFCCGFIPDLVTGEVVQSDILQSNKSM